MQAKPYVPMVALSGAWFHAMRTTYGWDGLPRETISVRHLALAVSLSVLWNIIALLSPIRKDLHLRYLDETFPSCMAGLACGAGLAIVHRIWPIGSPVLPGAELAAWMICTYLLLQLSVWSVTQHLISFVSTPVPVLLVGSGARGRSLRNEFSDRKTYKFIGVIDDTFEDSAADMGDYLGRIVDLAKILKERPVELVLIALPVATMYDTIQRVINTCETVGVDCAYPSNVFETSLTASLAPSRGPVNFAHLTSKQNDFRRTLKALGDLVLAALLLLAASPLMLVIALAIRLTSPGPILFSQTRYGIHRKRFAMYKFRTMVVDAEARQKELEHLNEAQGPVFKIRRDPRITPIGAFLRKTSLDELPQLFNVLRREMSLVGPRPLPLRDVGKFEEMWFLRRFSAKPGITCLWQVTGRSNLSFTDWIRLDLDYIDHWSLTLDLKILLMTVPAVVRGRGAS
jgi:exopolysaccharide biosynthesis polyprenyl glycosylphosphotransferase